MNFGFGVFGNQFLFGISFNEMMMFATAITFLFAFLHPIYTANQNERPVNYLDYPGDTVYAFNHLWFDDFRFFNKDNTLSCVAVLSSNWNFIPESGNSTSMVGNNSYVKGAPCSTIPTYNFPHRLNCEVVAWGLGLSNGTGGILGFLGSIPIVGPFSYFIWGSLFVIAKIIFGCAIGGFRLVIGVSIAVYWFFKAVLPLLELGLKLIG